MSEAIKNRAFRQEGLKSIIRDLHSGKDPAEVKSRFRELTEDIGAAELAELEQRMIAEGLPPEEVKRLCDVHVSVFRESLDRQDETATPPGHPVHTFLAENAAVSRELERLHPMLERLKTDGHHSAAQAAAERIQSAFERLLELDRHYSRKENLLFPYLEKYGITGPPSVMWGIDDDIRDGLKKARRLFEHSADAAGPDQMDDVIMPLLNQISEMIYKEEHILFPMSLETLTADEWGNIAAESPGIGFCLIDPPPKWQPYSEKPRKKAEGELPSGYLKLDTGALTLPEINLVFQYLPVDVTFIDRDDVVRYFSGRDRIFPRTAAVIGRKVQNCHPPGSIHVVNRLLGELKAGERDSADFWLTLDDRFVYIRYFAVRDAAGDYAGTLEVSQDVTQIRKLEGEKRLLDG